MTRWTRTAALPLLAPILGLALATAPGASQTQSATTGSGGPLDLYEEGTKRKAAGEWREALDLWSQAWDSLSAKGRYHPGLGISYIELATARNAIHHYEEATRVYLWGFSGEPGGEFNDLVREEISRIRPLLPESGGEEHVALLREEAEEDEPDPRAIKRYWIEEDPTPDDLLNLRLLEHWERIAHARESFTRNRNTPYQTDDRGLLWVRFGPPDKVQEGAMGADDFEMRVRIPDRREREEVRRFETHPSYEIWAYDELHPWDVVYFLVGNEGGSGPFRLLDGPRDLIPSGSFSPSTRRHTPGGIRAAHFFELFYYGELSRIGGPYARRFSELEAAWDRADGRQQRRRGVSPQSVRVPSESLLETFSNRFQQEDRNRGAIRTDVPLLTEMKDLPTVTDLVAVPVRLLGPERKPRLVVTGIASRRSRVSTVEEARIAEEGERSTQTLIVRNERLEEMGRLTAPSPAPIDGISTFTLRHPPTPLHFTLLVNPPRREWETVPPADHFQAPPPLSNDPSSLEVSDLVVGIPLPEGMDPESHPFPVLPTTRAWPGDPVRVYLEAYHLRLEEGEGVARFAVDVTLEPVDRPGDAPPVTLSMTLESTEPTARRTFDLDLREVPPGRYLLRVDVKDPASDEVRTRTRSLEVID